MGRDTDFAGKTIALTGGASGIGFATALNVFRRGANVAIADADPAALERAERELVRGEGDEGRVMFTRLDVRERAAVEGWMGDVVARFGALDGAANCAGVIGKHHGTRNVEDTEDEQWDLIIGVNLTGMMYCLRAQLKAVRSPGSIVCVSSVQGSMGFAKHGAYAASKHGILGLVRSAAKEVGGREVRVNAVTPGSVNTPLMDKRNALEGVDPSIVETPINRISTPDETGNVVAFLLSDESSFVTGATYAVDGGWAC